MDVVEFSEEDSYRYNPWRAPGRAPVVDACGQAGGEYAFQNIGGDGGITIPQTVVRERWDQRYHLHLENNGLFGNEDKPSKSRGVFDTTTVEVTRIVCVPQTSP